MSAVRAESFLGVVGYTEMKVAVNCRFDFIQVRLLRTVS